jgi:ATPase subunit of ABC transporter with duplicated ATPase domains
VAVDSVSCRIDRGQVVGFLRPNGAGKSTTMRLITQYYEPDAGSISLDGVPDAWQVNGHPADRRKVEDLLTSLADTAASGDLVAETAASYRQVGMDSASAKHVRAIARGTAVTDVIVGKAGQVYRLRTDLERAAGVPSAQRAAQPGQSPARPMAGPTDRRRAEEQHCEGGDSAGRQAVRSDQAGKSLGPDAGLRY